MAKQILLVLGLVASLTSCFKLPVKSKGNLSSSITSAIVSETSGTTKIEKSIASIRADATTATQLAVPKVEGLAGTSVAVPPGSLGISAELVVEQAADFGDTSMATEVGLGGDIEIANASPGVIIRPTENVDLTKPLTLSMPLPTTIGLKLAAGGGSKFAVFYKYFDPEQHQLVTGLKIVDGVTVTLGFDEASGRDVLNFDGYFGAYWVVQLSREVKKEEVPPQKVAEEPIVNKANIAVIETKGIVKEEDIVSRQAIPEVIWKNTTIVLDSASRKLKLSGNFEAGRSVTSCKLDLFESPTAQSGIQLESKELTSAEFLVTKAQAHSLCARFRCLDDQGRYTTSPWSELVAIPVKNPATVVRVSSSAPTGIYKLGDTIPVVVQFSEVVDLAKADGTVLNLRFLNATRPAAYVSGSGTDSLTFQYKIQEGDAAPTLTYPGLDALVLGKETTIKDFIGSSADLKLPALVSTMALNAPIVVDTTPPSAPTGVGFASAISGNGQMTVLWMPSVDANLKQHHVKLCDSKSCAGTCSKAEKTQDKTFSVANFAQGSYVACVQGEDAAGHLSPWAASQVPAIVDTTIPVVTSVTSARADAPLKEGEIIDIKVIFSKPVIVSNSDNFKLTLETGANDRDALFQTGSGSNTLLFRYTVMPGDVSADLDYHSIAALHGGVVADNAGHPAVFALPPPGSTLSLAGQKAFFIDGNPPSVPMNVTLPGSILGANNMMITWAASTDESLKSYHAKACTMADCATGCLASVASNSLSANLSGLVNGTSYFACVRAEDNVGHFSAWAPSTTSIQVDTDLPTITSITSGNADGYYVNGNTLNFQVSFSKNVNVLNPAGLRIALETGVTDREALYQSGSGSNILHFSYTVMPGDSSSDLDYMSTSALYGSAVEDNSAHPATLILPTPGSAGSIAGQKAIMIDTEAPALVGGITLPGTESGTTSFNVNWAANADANFKAYNVKACIDNACVATCTANLQVTTLSTTLTGVNGNSYYACVQAEDHAGHFSAWNASPSPILIDTTTPVVTNVSFPGADGYFGIGATISIDVHFSKNVIFSNPGAAFLMMETGATDTPASYVQGNGTNVIRFAFTVAAGQANSDLDVVSQTALNLNGGTLRDSGQHDADITLPMVLAVNRAFVVDTVVPTAPSNVDFGMASTSNQNFNFSFTAGTDAHMSQHNTRLCAQNDCVTNCSSYGATLTSPAFVTGAFGNSYFACAQSQDLAGNLSAWAVSPASINVNNAVPTVTSVTTPSNGSKGVGVDIDIHVQFSDVVNVSNPGALGFTLETGTTDRVATYIGGTGSSILSFRYTVQPADFNADLEYVSSTALSLGGATIRNASNIDANITLPAPYTAGSLSATSTVNVDTQAPYIVYVNSPAAPGVFGGSSAVQIDVHFSEPIVVINPGTASLVLNNGASLSTPTGTGSSIVSFVYYPSSGQDIAELDYLDPSALTGTIQDAAGNSANLQLPAPGTANSLAGNENIQIDTTVPTITMITSSNPSGWYKSGDEVLFQVHFSEPVNMFNNPHLTFHNGTAATTAPYFGGHGTSILTFRYFVQAGDNVSPVDANNVITPAGSGINDLAGNSASLAPPIPANRLISFRNLSLDGNAPTPPSSIGFANVLTNNPNIQVSWADSTDANFQAHEVKLCTANNCATGCTSPSTDPASPTTVTAPGQGDFYACVRGYDQANNFSAWIASVQSVQMDTSPPTIASITTPTPPGVYGVGGQMDIIVQFSKPIVLSNPDIQLRVNANSVAYAQFLSLADLDKIVFRYSIAAGDTTPDLDYFSSNPLLLGSGVTILDNAGNNALLTVPTPGAPGSLSTSAELNIDTQAPIPPYGLNFAQNPVDGLSTILNWQPSIDNNFQTHLVKLCANQDCSCGATEYTAAGTSRTISGNNHDVLYACVRGVDSAANMSQWAVSSQPVTFANTPLLGGLASVKVIGSTPNGFGRLEFTFNQNAAGAFEWYDIFYSETADPNSFNFASPLWPVPRNNTADPQVNDNKLQIDVALPDVKDGHFIVRYRRDDSQYPDTNVIVAPFQVLEGRPNFALIPKAYSGLSYDFYMMRYEASLGSGTNPGGDFVNTDWTSVRNCQQDFANFTGGGSCGNKYISRTAQAFPAAQPETNISWDTAYYACRNGSDVNVRMRLPTEEEWRRVARAVNGPDYHGLLGAYTATGPQDCLLSGGVGMTGVKTNCKNNLGIYDMHGNAREWVDRRMQQRDISALGFSRFSHGPMIGENVLNGIDNVMFRYHEIDPGSQGLALAMGASVQTFPAPGQGMKTYGPLVERWVQRMGDPLTGFRCAGFPAIQQPTPDQLALPSEPTYAAVDVIPEGKFEGDMKPEDLSINITSPGDSVASGTIQINWQPWQKTSCNPTCNTQSNFVYNIYRFFEPNHHGERIGMSWALTAANSAYPSHTPLDPLAVHMNGDRLYPFQVGNEAAFIAQVTNCSNGNPGGCMWTESTASGTGFNPNRVYRYVIVAKDYEGNEVLPQVQRFRSPYFAGEPYANGVAFRKEIRYRRASVALLDEGFQNSLGQPQFMAHVPMNKSGLDHDYFIQAHEASIVSGAFSNNGPMPNAVDGSGQWTQQGGDCQDGYYMHNSFVNVVCGGNNGTTAVLQSYAGTQPVTNMDQAAMFKACRNSGYSDGPISYRFGLPSPLEWIAAANWGDLDREGNAEDNFANAYASIATLELGSGIYCNTNNGGTVEFTGSNPNCVSQHGVYDMVGNVAEWTTGRTRGQVGIDDGGSGLWFNAILPNGSGLVASVIGNKFDFGRGYWSNNGSSLQSMAPGDGMHAPLSMPGNLYVPEFGGHSGMPNSDAGRFNVMFGAPNAVSNTAGGRCVY